MSKRHKWHKEIKAWADGAEIECRVVNNKVGISTEWFSASTPEWDNNDLLHRIKPQPKEPQYLEVYINGEENIIELGFNKLIKQFDYRHEYIGKIKLEVEDE